MSNKTTTLDITGMTCAACSNRIEKKLNRLDDVTAQVNLTTEKATIEYNADEYQPEAFVEQIKKLGYDVATEKQELDITGMTCAACSNRIEKVLNKMDGVQNATVNLTTEQALIEFYPSTTNTDQLIQRIHKLGYDAKPITNNNLEKSSRKEQELKLKRTKLMISNLICTTFTCNAHSCISCSFTRNYNESMDTTHSSYTCTIYYRLAILCRCL